MSSHNADARYNSTTQVLQLNILILLSLSKNVPVRLFWVIVIIRMSLLVYLLALTLWLVGERHTAVTLLMDLLITPVLHPPSYPRLESHGRNLRNCHNISTIPNRTNRFENSPIPYFIGLLHSK